MKKIPSVTTLFLGMGIAAFLFAGCEQPTGPSGSGDKSSGESAKIKSPQSKDTNSVKTGTIPRPLPLDPSHIRPLPDSAVTLPGHGPYPVTYSGVTVLPDDSLVFTPPLTTAPGPVIIKGDSSTSPSDLPPGCKRVGYADGKDHVAGDGYTGPYSGTVVCPMPNP